MKRKFITLTNLFLRYPYKCQEIYGKVVPVPYVPKQEVNCSHNYSVDYKLYRKILKVYFKYVVQFLIQGNRFEIPSRLGHFLIKRYKYKGFIRYDRNTIQENGKFKMEYVKNDHTNGYIAKTTWFRYRSPLKYPGWWMFRPNPFFRKQLADHIKSDFNNINKYYDD
jgi:hypothetical protein